MLARGWIYILLQQSLLHLSYLLCSSLVNYVVNRKALASISDIPGHTQKFHFFSVNKARHDLPAFYLIDVPGLGYAEAEGDAKVLHM